MERCWSTAWWLTAKAAPLNQRVHAGAVAAYLRAQPRLAQNPIADQEAGLACHRHPDLAVRICGGGGYDRHVATAVAAGGTGSYASGPVASLGSIIVSGVRYNVEIPAAVSGDDSCRLAQQADRSWACLVEVRGSGVDRGRWRGTEHRHRHDRESGQRFCGLARNIVAQPGWRASPASRVFGRTGIPSMAKNGLLGGPGPTAGPVAVFGLVSAPADLHPPRRCKRLAFAPVYKVTGKVVAAVFERHAPSVWGGPHLRVRHRLQSLPSGSGVGRSCVRARVVVPGDRVGAGAGGVGSCCRQWPESACRWRGSRGHRGHEQRHALWSMASRSMLRRPPCLTSAVVAWLRACALRCAAGRSMACSWPDH